MAIWGDFQGVIGATGGGRVVKNHENWGDVVYGWSLRKCSCQSTLKRVCQEKKIVSRKIEFIYPEISIRVMFKAF